MFVIILLPIFMFNSALGELFKLPDFLIHFSEHRTQDKSIGICDFIYMHYVGSDQNDSDQDKDMQLPFKKVEDPFSFQIAVFSNSNFISENQLEFIDAYLQIIFKNSQPQTPPLAELFRPPCCA